MGFEFWVGLVVCWLLVVDGWILHFIRSFSHNRSTTMVKLHKIEKTAPGLFVHNDDSPPFVPLCILYKRKEYFLCKKNFKKFCIFLLTNEFKRCIMMSQRKNKPLLLFNRFSNIVRKMLNPCRFRCVA